MKKIKTKNIMYLKTISNKGIITLKKGKYLNVSVTILDKVRHTNYKPCFTHIGNVIILDEHFKGMDACCFCEVEVR